MKTRVAYFGVFTALALIFSYVESLIPFQIGIPGVKLGLANLIIVIALYKMSLREAYLLSVTRVVLAGLIFGSMFSILGVSIAGGVMHNVGQLIVAMFVVQTFSVSYYIPVLLIAGLITGLVIGIAADSMLRRLTGITLN